MSNFSSKLDEAQNENKQKHHEEVKSSLSGAFVEPNPQTPSQNSSQNAEVEALKQEVTSLKDSMVRLLADAENLRKRHQKEIENTVQFGVASLLKDLVEPYEQFFMAIASIEKLANEQTKPILEGIEMTRLAFEKSLSKHGLVRIFPKGERFNHDFHQAISQVPQQGVETGIVIDVVQAGYVLNGRNIKPALVVVSA